MKDFSLRESFPRPEPGNVNFHNEETLVISQRNVVEVLDLRAMQTVRKVEVERVKKLSKINGNLYICGILNTAISPSLLLSLLLPSNFHF